MEEESLNYGPNGSLVFCLEYLLEHFDWFDDHLIDIEDDYLIIDCPGQIELYTHLNVMVQFIKHLQQLNYNVCVVYIQDAQFMDDCHKFIGNILSALSTMVLFESPHVNVLTKVDLLTDDQKLLLEKFI